MLTNSAKYQKPDPNINLAPQHVEAEEFVDVTALSMGAS